MMDEGLFQNKLSRMRHMSMWLVKKGSVVGGASYFRIGAIYPVCTHFG